MLWAKSFESWIRRGVTSQPSAVLLTPDSTIIAHRVCRFPEDVRERAAQYIAG